MKALLPLLLLACAKAAAPVAPDPAGAFQFAATITTYPSGEVEFQGTAWTNHRGEQVAVNGLALPPVFAPGSIGGVLEDLEKSYDSSATSDSLPGLTAAGDGAVLHVEATGGDVFSGAVTCPGFAVQGPSTARFGDTVRWTWTGDAAYFDAWSFQPGGGGLGGDFIVREIGPGQHELSVVLNAKTSDGRIPPAYLVTFTSAKQKDASGRLTCEIVREQLVTIN